MQIEKPYRKFLEMGNDRFKYVQDQQQGEAKSVDFLNSKWSQADFLQFYGSQDKKSIKLSTYRQPATKQVKGVIVLFHSIGMHAGVFSHLANKLGESGYICYAFDQRGHGKSQGQRGYMDSKKQILKDTTNFITNVVKMNPDLPLFYIGHGAGALIALTMLREVKQFKVAGVIVGNPSLKKPQSSKVLSAISSFALKLMPNKAGLFNFNFHNLTRNPSASAILAKDPLMYHEKVYVGTLSQMQQMMDVIDEKYWPKLQFPPIAIIQGELDRASDAINAINFYEKLKNNDKQFWYYQKMWHMFLYEEEYAEIQGKIVSWLDKHLGKK